MQGLRLLANHGMASQICITFTEMQHNFEEIPDLLKIGDDMGVRQFVTGTLVPGGRAVQPGGLAPPTPAQYESLLARYQEDKTFRDRYHRIGNVAAMEWFMDDGDAAGTCCTFIETPYVTAEGNLYPCVMLHAEDFAATGVYDRPLTAAITENIDPGPGCNVSATHGFTRMTPARIAQPMRNAGPAAWGGPIRSMGISSPLKTDAVFGKRFISTLLPPNDIQCRISLVVM